MKTLKEMLAEARQVVPEQGPAEVKRRLDAGEPLVVDRRARSRRVPRRPHRGRDEHQPRLPRVPHRHGAAPDPDDARSCSTARPGCARCSPAKALKELGYENVINLQGGFQKWAQSGLPVVKDKPLTTEQIQRYSRHFLLTAGGREGPAQAAALEGAADRRGRARLADRALPGRGGRRHASGLMDGDVVDVSNLQRQILHTTAERRPAQGRVGHARRSAR